MNGITSAIACGSMVATHAVSHSAAPPDVLHGALPAAALTLGHFSALLLFAALMSIAFAFLGRTSPRDRMRFALRCFLLFLGAALLLGWLMYPFSR